MSNLKDDNLYLVTGPLNPLSSDQYFDDCPICQVLRNSEKEKRNPTARELYEAFSKSNPYEKTEG